MTEKNAFPFNVQQTKLWGSYPVLKVSKIFCNRRIALAPELPDSFLMSTMHDFTWLPALRFQQPRELIVREKCRGGARMNSETIDFAGF